MKNIDNKQAYYQAMAEIESYIQKGFSNLTDAEDARLDELSKAVEVWEAKEYPLPLKPDIKTIFLYVMEVNSFNQSRLAEELRISKAFLSEMIRGRKDPNVGVLKNLHTRFKIDGNVLLESI